MMRRHRIAAATALVAGALAVLAVAPAAYAYVYWTNQGTAAIGRADLNGAGADQGFLSSGAIPQGLAVDDSHIYWALFATPPYISRANLDGTDPYLSFVPTDTGPRDVAVDGGHVYWANGANDIGRANLDGTGVDNAFLNVGTTRAIAVDGSHIWWTNTGAGAIGRANLDGSDADPAYISVPGSPSDLYGLAVDATHVYWSEQGGNAIGRANVDGTGVVANFISGLNGPRGVDVDGAHLYWANAGTNSIGRARIDGTGPDVNFITGANDPWGVAVDALPLPPSGDPPSNEFTLGKVKRNKDKGTAKLTVSVPGAGELDLARTKSVKADEELAEIAGERKLSIKPKGRAKRKLNRKGVAKVKAKVTYTPDGGSPSTESETVKLVKR